jgi:hypothetical protein
MAAISKWRASAMSKASQLSNIRGSSHIQAATTGAITLAASGAAGVLDAKVGEVQGVKPSIAAGLVAATGGVLTRSPKLLQVATGCLAPHAYMAAFDWASENMTSDADNAADEDDE